MKKHTQFIVDGKPFYSLGGQVHNASGYAVKDLARAVQAIHAVGGNTIAIPVYWEIIEPEEDVFDFSLVGEILEYCRQERLKVVFLWFGTWKNGTMKYTPPWVKANPERFHRVLNEGGERTAVLSSHCKANFEADKKAFVELIRYIKEVDGLQRTVIGVQVENEPGIIGDTTRDWSPEGDAAMAEPVPAELLACIGARQDSPVTRAWKAAGGAASGNWEAVFGDDGAEFMTAWSIANYIDAIAAAGKEIYDDIVYYVNVWLDFNTWNVPGMSYPSGGAVTKTLDIWKCATRAIDFISPDNYKPDVETYWHIMDVYARDDNPLYIPESGNTNANIRGIFRTIAEKNCIGNHIFGIERIFQNDGQPRPIHQQIAKSMRMVSAVLPLINRYQGTGRITAVTQNAGQMSQLYDFGDWVALAEFGKKPWPQAKTDYLHMDDQNEPGELGRGLVFQAGPDEFYIVGDGIRLHFDRKIKSGRTSQIQMSDFLQTRSVNYAIHTEGRFDDCGAYVVNRHRNGDENDFGVWMSEDVGVVHVLLTD